MSTVNEKPKLHNIITTLMEEVGVNEAELARKTDIPQPTLHRILSGATRSPRGNSLAPIANFFSVNINQLMGVDPLPEDRVVGTYNSRIYGWTSLPVLSWANASNLKKTKKQLQNEKWSEWTSTDLKVSEDAFALTVSGDAMAPTFIEDATLIVEPNVEPKNRDYVIVADKNATSANFRQYLLDGSDVYLRTVDEGFRTMMMDKGTKIIGTVVQARMDFRANEKGEV